MIRVRHKHFGKTGFAVDHRPNGMIRVHWDNPGCCLYADQHVFNLVFIVPAGKRTQPPMPVDPNEPHEFVQPHPLDGFACKLCNRGYLAAIHYAPRP